MNSHFIFSRTQINQFLARNNVSKLDPAIHLISKASKSLTDAQRLVLAVCLENPRNDDGRKPLLFQGNPDLVCNWIVNQGFPLDPLTGRYIREAFSRDSSSLIRKIFDHNPGLREKLPCALAIPYWSVFAMWLFVDGVRRFGVTPEDIIWFLLESAEDPSLGLLDTWLRNPEWQSRWPNALNADGWVGFSREIAAFDPKFKPFESMWNLDPDKEFKKNIYINNKIDNHLGTNIIGHFCYPSGLKEAADQMAMAISRAGGITSLRDFPSSYAADLPTRKDYLGMEEWPVTAFVMAPEHDLDVVYRCAGLKKASDQIRVGVWYWELEEFPEGWVTRARQYQEIWAPSRFIADSMKKKLDVPVLHMAPGVELEKFDPLPRSRFGLPETEFLFLNIFDMCSVFERKNPMAIVEAFSAAFPHGGAKLVIKVNRGDFNPPGLATLRSAIQRIDGILINATFTRKETYALMACCDSYVSLHRSEGFGLTMAEAMLMEKPVIATGYSGNLDFMEEKAACLIPYEMVVLDKKYHVYEKGKKWAEPSIEKAAQALRWVINQPKAVREMGCRGRMLAENKLSLKLAGERYLERVKFLQAEKLNGKSFSS